MDSSFSLVMVKTDIQDLMLCCMAKEGTISEQLTMYCMVALSTPHCPGHTVYTHHTQPMQGPGGCTEVPGSALGNNCDKMHSVPRGCIPTVSIAHQMFHCI